MLTAVRSLRWHIRSPIPTYTIPLRQSSKQVLRSTASPSTIATATATEKVPLPVTRVQTKQQAAKVLRILNKNQNVLWACDTEVVDIDIREQGPVGNGKVICASIYGGEDIDFGSGPTLWIENAGDAAGILQEFKGWFEDEKFKKVWHNYGFDRHVMENEGICCKGFGGDTMHMARLWDTSRDKTGGGDGYSLASLTEQFFRDDSRFIKTSMKELFGIAKVKKDGTSSKVKVLPNLLELQNSSQRAEWIDYSARDAAATWWVRHELEIQLKKMPWVIDGKLLGNMFEFYNSYLREFGELLTDMERNGIRVDTQNHLRLAEIRAREERDLMDKMFMEWVSEICPEGKHINIASTAQMQQLLFGHFENFKRISTTRTFKIDKSDSEIVKDESKAKAANPYALLASGELKLLCKERGLTQSGSKIDVVNRLIYYDNLTAQYSSLPVETIIEMNNARGLTLSGTIQELVKAYVSNEVNAKRKDNSIPLSVDLLQQNVDTQKYREITIESIGMEPKDFTPTGMPQVSASVLKRLAGKNVFGEEPVWGDALHAFGTEEEGKKACRALGALAAVGQIDTTINTFLVPLQALVDKNNRIHCSLNLNTETGRLSSRRPNLQNQPALEKDQYKIRDAFVAEEGKTFIVADYGQLELRILAHITKCKSMLDAFSSGGCFHSRTAVGMYDYIREAVESGKVLLEWDYSKGQPNVPLVKDTYASERRKAKTLNFSIAYGKTVHGLAQDWGITKEEAQETLDAWYRDRPEVKEWQQQTQLLARKAGYVRTIMGRYRRLPDASGRGPGVSHALRAAINTPIQGSAADVVMMAMLKLWKSEKLKSLGWKLLLQIHDEVIMEGPKESKDEAMAEVLNCMEDPFDGVGLSKLLVHLDVDAKSADTWYKAK